MRRRKFLLSIAAAGLGLPSVSRAAPTNSELGESKHSLMDVLEEDSPRILAHRSHSSHSSHRSSSSYRRRSRTTLPSSYNSGYKSPSVSNSTPPSSILPNRPTNSTQPLVPEKFTKTAKRVQRALKSYGYYNGPIDGKIGESSRSALSAFQRDYSLKITGTITPEVLKTFGIS